ncbi:MAG: hypothetical protein RLZZ505_1152 [Verrucomicrobiota bacterium]|jgi:hypothetical protein
MGFGITPLAAILFASCAANRTPYSPDTPPTIGMPAELSDRERHYMPQIDSALRREGLVPVAYDRGETQLEFRISEGSIHTDTVIKLIEGESLLARGDGRAAGVPMVGRSDVAEKSFTAAFADFKNDLSGVAARRGWNRTATYFNNAEPPPFSGDYQLPPY